jgi:hypothetical protein
VRARCCSRSNDEWPFDSSTQVDAIERPRCVGGGHQVGRFDDRQITHAADPSTTRRGFMLAITYLSFAQLSFLSHTRCKHKSARSRRGQYGVYVRDGEADPNVESLSMGGLRSPATPDTIARACLPIGIGLRGGRRP